VETDEYLQVKTITYTHGGIIHRFERIELQACSSELVQLLDRRLVLIGHDDDGAFGVERLRDSTANSPRGTGDNAPIIIGSKRLACSARHCCPTSCAMRSG